MTSIFEDKSSDSSDGETSFNINKAYADRYDNWRQKEELQKLKDKYGSEDETSSSSSSDDEDAEELTAEVEREWLKAFAAVRSKDPKIYSKDVKFFSKKKDVPKKKEKEKSMFLKDYERKVLLEKGGIVNEDSDDDDDMAHPGPSYFEEQEEIKKSIKTALSSDDETDDDLLTKRQKTQDEQRQEEDDYHEWLKGQKTNLEDEQAGKELSGLKNYWNNPDLEDGEKFLRDYILNKGYIDKETSRIPSYDEIVNDEELSEDEEALKKQEIFEDKYNFRFEEPDADFIKSYPRTIQESVRRKDDKRSRKRAEIKERKEQEKKRRREELKQLKNLKKKEILEKLKKLKEITGNATVGFGENDLEDDFDPLAHDRKMQEAFDDDYYDEADAEKPVFSDSDDDYQEAVRNGNDVTSDVIDDPRSSEPHCDDPEFNMDADFDPTAQKERKNKKKKKNKLTEILELEKPAYDPGEKTYEEYLDEYYKLDYDDMIGDMPCRFKYRKVVPNDFGLSTEEILACPDRELNSWVSLRKTSQYRTDDEEMRDVKKFRAKARNQQKKLNVLASLRGPDEEGSQPQPGPSTEKSGKKKKRKLESMQTSQTSEEPGTGNTSHLPEAINVADNTLEITEQNKRKRNNSEMESSKKKPKVQQAGGKVRKNKNKKRKNAADLTDERLQAYGINPKKLPYMSHKFKEKT